MSVDRRGSNGSVCSEGGMRRDSSVGSGNSNSGSSNKQQWQQPLYTYPSAAGACAYENESKSQVFRFSKAT
jgi:hypothetical protein